MPRFNTDIVLKVILQTHINNSLTKPVTYHKFPMLKFDVASFINDDTADDLFKACYPRYKYSRTRQWRKTTLDIDPGAFINIFLDSLEYAIANKEDIIVPNGCCDTPFCDLLEFYTLLYSYFKKIEFRNIVLQELISQSK